MLFNGNRFRHTALMLFNGNRFPLNNINACWICSVHRQCLS